MRNASDEYFTEEDALARWIDEECVTGKNQWGIGANLWARWKAWSETNNEWTGARKSFTQGLNDRGFPADRSQRCAGMPASTSGPATDFALVRARWRVRPPENHSQLIETSLAKELCADDQARALLARFRARRA